MRTASAHPALDPASEEWAARVHRSLAGPLAEAVRKGEIHDDVPIAEIAAWIVRVALQVADGGATPGHGRSRGAARWFLLPSIAPYPYGEGSP